MDYKKKDLTNKVFIGVVENVYDETRKGRIQVRVQSVFNKIPLEHIPWAEPQRSLDGKNFSVPAIGKIVNVIFNNGNIYEPMYIYSQNYNTNLQQKLNDMSDKEYENFASILMDHRTQIYSDDENLRLDYKFNQISLKEDGINIHLKDNNQELHLGHNIANQSVVLGDHFMTWFDGFMQKLLTPTSLIGNIGSPILKPTIDTEIKKYQALRQTFLSQHVKVVDNSGCLDTGEVRKDSPAQDDMTLLNNEKILESKMVDEKLKKKIKDKRIKEFKENENNKPDSNDDAFSDERMKAYEEDTEKYGERDYPEKIEVNIEQTEDITDLFTDNEKASIENTKKIEERKNTPKTKNKDIEVDDSMLYSDIWVGYSGRDADSYEIDKIENEDYGNYTHSSTNSNSKDIKHTAKKRISKDGKEVFNGKLDLDDLVPVDGFLVSEKPKTIYLEKNAAVAWLKLNEDFKKEFNKSISINGKGQDYRTYETQLNYWVQYQNGGNLAARPGTSNHGWGVACDINYHGKGVLSWLEKNAPKYNIYKKVPSENWHWVYTGKTIYS